MKIFLEKNWNFFFFFFFLILVKTQKKKKNIRSKYKINNFSSKILKIVERKLNGYIDSENFSCEGQVDKLIQYAMDLKKLSEMYIGWSAFL